jgi:hypothetical protein
MEGPLCSVLAFERTQEILILFVLDGLLGGHNHELEIGEFPKSRGMGRAISVADCLDHICSAQTKLVQQSLVTKHRHRSPLLGYPFREPWSDCPNHQLTAMEPEITGCKWAAAGEVRAQEARVNRPGNRGVLRRDMLMIAPHK